MMGSKKKLRSTKIDSLIGRKTEILGDLRFSGGLHVDGLVKGNVYADDDSGALLTLSEFGTIEGEVRVPNVVLNGSVIGDVYARDRIELAPNARITGNVYYTLIEMAMGAEVNGSLVHRGPEATTPRLQLERDGTLEVGDL
jgi:cytoskeletal protein CcmA (bactofilin family)